MVPSLASYQAVAIELRLVQPAVANVSRRDHISAGLIYYKRFKVAGAQTIAIARGLPHAMQESSPCASLGIRQSDRAPIGACSPRPQGHSARPRRGASGRH